MTRDGSFSRTRPDANGRWLPTDCPEFVRRSALSGFWPARNEAKRLARSCRGRPGGRRRGPAVLDRLVLRCPTEPDMVSALARKRAARRVVGGVSCAVSPIDSVELARLGPPDAVSGDVQQFWVAVPGQPQQAYFQIFLNKDSDYDGIPDGYEVAILKTDPLNPDSNSTRDANGDGLPDYPALGGNGIADGDEDFDADGLTTSYELALGVDPLVPQSATDTDADGLPDWVESLITLYTGDPAPAPLTDSDGDGVDNFTEWTIRTDPSYGFDAAFADFSGLPDEQRVILPVHIQFTAPPAGFQPAGGGSATTDDEAYIHFTVAGVEALADTFKSLRTRQQMDRPPPAQIRFDGAWRLVSGSQHASGVAAGRARPGTHPKHTHRGDGYGCGGVEEGEGVRESLSTRRKQLGLL